MSEFPLKILAMLTMVCDHLAVLLLLWGVIGEPLYTIMRSIGRCAFLIYAFLMAEGYRHLKNRPERLKSQFSKFMLLLLVSEAPYDYFEEGTWWVPGDQSVMFTLLIGFAMLVLLDYLHGKRREQAFAVFSAAAVTFFICSNFRFAGVLLMLGFYWYLQRFSKAPLGQRILVLLAIMLIYIPIYTWARACFGPPAEFVRLFKDMLPWFAVHLMMVVPLALYNGEVGYRSKPFQLIYTWFYPVHLALLALLRLALGL